jgi:DNA-binding MarR family transcriptional regulator
MSGHSRHAAIILRAVLSNLQGGNIDMSLRHLEILLLVAEQEDMLMRDIETVLALPQTTVSRVVLEMLNTARKGVEGMGLLETYEDPDNRRYKRVRLTKHGQAVMDRAARMLNIELPV